MKNTVKKSTKLGSYSVLSALIIIAIAVVVYLMSKQLPVDIAQKDISSRNLMALSEQTTSVVSGLDQDVTVYIIAQKGQEDKTIANLLKRYDALSDRLTVETKDPVLYPQFTKQYTQDNLQSSSLIVVSGDKSQVIAYSDIYVTDYNSYYTTGEVTQSFNAESELTSAIFYVTGSAAPLIYVLSGHEETALSDTLTKAVKKQNMETESLSLLTVEAVPDDAACVLINAPQRDISEAEKELLLDYLAKGGRLLLITGFSDVLLPNLCAVAEEYGMTLDNGLVMEEKNFVQRQDYILPTLQSHITTDPLIQKNLYVMFPSAQGISLPETKRDTVNITPLARTSDNSYEKMNVMTAQTYLFEEGDIEGPITVAAAATEEVTDVNALTDETRLVWITSGYVLSDEINAVVSGGNQDWFLNLMGWFTEQESAISIHAKDLSMDRLTVPQSTIGFLAVVLIFILPIVILAAGAFYVFSVRRKQK